MNSFPELISPGCSLNWKNASTQRIYPAISMSSRQNLPHHVMQNAQYIQRRYKTSHAIIALESSFGPGWHYSLKFTKITSITGRASTANAKQALRHKADAKDSLISFGERCTHACYTLLTSSLWRTGIFSLSNLHRQDNTLRQGRSSVRSGGRRTGL